MTMTTSERIVDQASEGLLRAAYRALVKAGSEGVRAAWRFGQQCDSLSDLYSFKELAECLGITTGTIYRYRRLFAAYQRPELAVAAAEQLGTFNIHLIAELVDQLIPVDKARPVAGRRFRYTCRNCHSHDVAREEIDPAEAEVMA